MVVRALVDRLVGEARALAQAYSPIFFGVAVALAKAEVDIDSTAAVAINGADTRITGRAASTSARFRTGCRSPESQRPRGRIHPLPQDDTAG